MIRKGIEMGAPTNRSLSYVVVYRPKDPNPVDGIAVALKAAGETYCLSTFRVAEEGMAKIFARDVNDIIKKIVHAQTNNLLHKIKLLEKEIEGFRSLEAYRQRMQEENNEGLDVAHER